MEKRDAIVMACMLVLWCILRGPQLKQRRRYRACEWMWSAAYQRQQEQWSAPGRVWRCQAEAMEM